jgi:pimeloyl-ACP methyl ester carboxylesterase
VTFDIQHAVVVAKRQAFGPGFEPRADDEVVAEKLKNGFLTLTPHPEVPLELPIDWEQDPLGQRNWRAQLQMLRWLDPIRRLAQGGDRSFMPLWEDVARHWIDANPPSKTAKSYAWADMVDAMRAHALLLGLPYLEDDPTWVLQALETHGAWMADPQNLGHSNHALHQHAALLMIGSALRSTEWTGLALERIVTHVTSEFDEQGVNREAAPGYWLLNYKWVRDIAQRVELEGFDASRVWAAIAKAPEALAHASRPDGTLEVIGDTAPDTRLKVGGESVELLYVSTEGADGSPPATTAAVFEAGYAFGRSGWGETERRPVEETFYSLRFGPANGVHGHQDGGSVTYFAGGKPVLTEAGKYAYVSDAMRKYALGRLGHNVVRIRGAEYDKSTIVELVDFQVGGTYDYYHLRDRGYRGVTIDREVVFARGTESLLVVDTVRSLSEVTAECRWHLDTSAEVDLQRQRVAVSNGNAQATLLWGGRAPKLEVTRGSRQPFDGWLSPQWGAAAETNVIKAVQTGTKFRVTTAICPGDVGGDRLAALPQDDGSTAFVVEGNGVREQIVLGRGRVDVIPDGDTSPARAGADRSRPTLAPLPPSVDEALRFEAENTTARTALSGGEEGEIEPAIQALSARIDAGHDYGAGATLRDIAARFGARGHRDIADPRTRSAFYFEAEAEPSRQFKVGPVLRYANNAVEYDLSSDRSTHIVELGPVALPMLVQRAKSDVVVVALHGALNRAKTALPRFERVRSLGDLGVNVLAIGDPTLDLDSSLSLAWYLGTRTLDLHEVLARVVSTVARQLGTGRTILLGSSGGGFAALQLGALLPGATVVAMNPQTDVTRYHARFSERALDAIFGVDGAQDEAVLHRISVARRYAGVEHETRIRYLANRGDIHHVKEHAEPFWSSCGDRTDLEITWLDLGNGHISPGLETVNMVLKQEMER